MQNHVYMIVFLIDIIDNILLHLYNKNKNNILYNINYISIHLFQVYYDE